ncbi:MAG: hypothetical protein IJ721_02975 [Bacteroidales bacterium]|nr:hypothetical protein [Bacteroidales bacterium]
MENNTSLNLVRKPYRAAQCQVSAILAESNWMASGEATIEGLETDGSEYEWE